jgi:hypothetical protein
VFENRKIWYDNADFAAAYWQNSTAMQSDVQFVFDEWKQRLLGASAATGAGPDANGLSGGFPLSITRWAQNASMWAGSKLDVVAYEGGPSIYTDSLDSSWKDTPADKATAFITLFASELNRDWRFASLYRAHLHMAFARGECCA